MTNLSHRFRHHHLFALLSEYEVLDSTANNRERGVPLDAFMRNYFHKFRSIGSHDRRFISEAVYGMVRLRGLLDHLSPKPLSWENRFKTYQKPDLLSYLNDPTIPPHVRVSFPKICFHLISNAYGEKEALNLCKISNTQAPITIRANLLKINREDLRTKWQDSYSTSLCSQASAALNFNKKINLFALPEFKEGLFEIQDEGSQLVADLVDPKPGELVLDFCAGSGGKSLAFVHKMKQKGQIYLHDIRSSALEEAKKRLYRAGVQNAQLLHYDSLEKKRLQKKFDWILVDAPCSGSGTYRRNPDMKWKFHPEMLTRLVEEQRLIFKEALQFLSPTGSIVYATCSIFPQENEEQVSFFEKHDSVKLSQKIFKCFPQEHAMDGFFAAVFKNSLFC